MTTYMGPIGSLLSVKCPSDLSRGGGRSVSFSDTMSRRKAFIGRNTPREWSVDIGVASPGDLAGFEWLANYGAPPFAYYSDDAVLHNILSPAAAAFAPGAYEGLEGALVEVEPGVHVKSALPDGPDNAVGLPFAGDEVDPMPIPAGMPLTFSAWTRGGSRFQVFWRDISGEMITTESGDIFDTADWSRQHATLTPPTRAVQMSVNVFAAQVAGPAVSITDSLTPYAPGRGAKRAVVYGMSESLILVTRDKSLTSASFTVSEVG